VALIRVRLMRWQYRFGFRVECPGRKRSGARDVWWAVGGAPHSVQLAAKSGVGSAPRLPNKRIQQPRKGYTGLEDSVAQLMRTTLGGCRCGKEQAATGIRVVRCYRCSASES